MSLWRCSEHGIYGGRVFCPKCGGNGEIVTIAICDAPAKANAPFDEWLNAPRQSTLIRRTET